MQGQQFTQSLIWKQTRNMRWVFLAGLFIGVLLGWLLHNVINTIMRFGVVAVLLIPLAALGYFWWRSSRERQRVQSMTIMEWQTQQMQDPTQRTTRDPFVRPHEGDVIDVSDVKDTEWRR